MDMVEIECKEKMNVILNHIVEKAEFLVKLNVSESLLFEEK